MVKKKEMNYKKYFMISLSFSSLVLLIMLGLFFFALKEQNNLIGEAMRVNLNEARQIGNFNSADSSTSSPLMLLKNNICEMDCSGTTLASPIPNAISTPNLNTVQNPNLNAPIVEICNDHKDNDNNGKVDCDDAYCWTGSNQCWDLEDGPDGTPGSSCHSNNDCDSGFCAWKNPRLKELGGFCTKNCIKTTDCFKINGKNMICNSVPQTNPDLVYLCYSPYIEFKSPTGEQQLNLVDCLTNQGCNREVCMENPEYAQYWTCQ